MAQQILIEFGTNEKSFWKNGGAAFILPSHGGLEKRQKTNEEQHAVITLLSRLDEKKSSWKVKKSAERNGYVAQVNRIRIQTIADPHLSLTKVYGVNVWNSLVSTLFCSIFFRPDELKRLKHLEKRNEWIYWNIIVAVCFPAHCYCFSILGLKPCMKKQIQRAVWQ